MARKFPNNTQAEAANLGGNLLRGREALDFYSTRLQLKDGDQ